MKQKITTTVLIILAIVFTVLTLFSWIIGCSGHSKASASENNFTNSTCVYSDGSRCWVQLIKVRGHEYLVSYTSCNYGGTCIIHAAHCPCQTK